MIIFNDNIMIILAFLASIANNHKKVNISFLFGKTNIKHENKMSNSVIILI